MVRLLDSSLSREQAVQVLRQVRSGESIKVLKRGRRSLVLRVDLSGGLSVVAKRYPVSTWRGYGLHLIGMDKPARSVRASRMVRRLGFRVPAMHALLREGGFLRPTHLTLLSEYVDGVVSLPYLSAKLAPAERLRLVEQAVVFVRQTHDARLYSPVLTKNIEVESRNGTWRFNLFDMDGTHYLYGLQLVRRRKDFLRVLQYGWVTDRETIARLRDVYLGATPGRLSNRLQSRRDEWMPLDGLVADATPRTLAPRSA